MKETFYRLIIRVKPDGEEEVTLCPIERGEERTNNHNLYIRDLSGEPYRFDDKESALDWLNEYINTDYIDPNYRVPKQEKLFNDKWKKENGVPVPETV